MVSLSRIRIELEASIGILSRQLEARLKAADDQFRLILSSAQLCAACMDFAGARTHLECLQLNHSHRTEECFVEFVSTAVYCLQFDIAVVTLARRFPILQDIKLALYDDDGTVYSTRPGVVRWERLNSGQVTFYFASTFWNIERMLGLQRWVVLLPILSKYLSETVRAAWSLHINLGDRGWAPGLAFSEKSSDFYLLPDTEFLESHAYAATATVFSNYDVPWKDRTPVAFWRGGTQGSAVGGWRNLPRLQLCDIVRQSKYSDKFDVGITRIVTSHVVKMTDVDEIAQSGFMRPFVPISSFVRYKYHIDIDGHTNAWSALFQKLLTGSPVLKVASAEGYRQWYYDKLLPWLNYVPVESDMSDLVEKTLWLINNDEKAREIGLRGRELAESLDYESQIAAAFNTIDMAIHRASALVHE